MKQIRHILHISALPIWPIKGKGGMPSLAETLRGHRRAGHVLTVLLPEYNLFDESFDPIEPPADIDYKVVLVPCGWLRPLKRLRSRLQRIRGGNELWFPVRWLLNMSMFICFTFSMLRAGIKQQRLNPHRFDLIYAHNQYASLAGYLLRRRLRIPNVTRLYGTFLADLMHRPFVTLRYPTAAAGYRVPCNLLIVGNDGTRGDDVARKFDIPPDKFRFWQNGIDPPSAPPTITRAEFLHDAPDHLRPESVWICSCSRLSYWKRLDRMLNALQVCRNAGGDAQLLIAGDGPERDALIKLTDKLNIAGQIVWLGALEHDRIWALMNLCDIFMITNDVTNRCNPLYEAINAGLPVVSVRDRSTEDLLVHQQNALLTAPNDTQALGQNLHQLCTDPSLRQRLGAAQKPVAKSFWSWDERLECEVRTLENLVNAHKLSMASEKTN